MNIGKIVICFLFFSLSILSCSSELDFNKLDSNTLGINELDLPESNECKLYYGRPTGKRAKQRFKRTGFWKATTDKCNDVAIPPNN